jgi:hypothetical protein
MDYFPPLTVSQFEALFLLLENNVNLGLRRSGIMTRLSCIGVLRSETMKISSSEFSYGMGVWW